MDIVKALAPAFAAGFAVQQLLEIVTSFLNLGDNSGFQKFKKPILGIVSLMIGFALAFGVDQLHILSVLLTTVTTDAAGKTTTVTPQVNNFLDAFVTGLIISAGTEGINSILKFLKYTKEDKKNQAAAKVPEGAAAGGAAPTKKALKDMNQQ
jgi:hypothetical protein